MVSMCDKSTRLWCCRICLVLTVSSVLLTMMFQIWSYYFSLVRDMDALSVSSPSLGALISVCNRTVVSSWNTVCSETDLYWNCLSDVQERMYVDSTCSGSGSGSGAYLIPLEECCRVMVWILPW